LTYSDYITFYSLLSFFFFFFQAEDGIRDFHVTGVQTCVSDLLTGEQHSKITELINVVNDVERVGDHSENIAELAQEIIEGNLPRSEERRVGKECRSRWAAEGEKKNE